MDPSRKGAALATEIDVQRQTVPVDGEDDDQHQHQHQQHERRREPDDAPPPYEMSSAGSTSASANPDTTVYTQPSSSRPSRSSFGEDVTAGLLADSRGQKGGVAGGEAYLLTPRPRLSQGQREDDEGYARTDPMSVEASDKWESMVDKPGCCFSDTGGCCFSRRGGCCCSDRGGGCCSDTEGCCFSSNGACCCSGGGGRPQL